MSDLVGNPEDRFSHNEAHLFIMQSCNIKEMSIVQLKLIMSINETLCDVKRPNFVV